jgi:hypothetical protein
MPGPLVYGLLLSAALAGTALAQGSPPTQSDRTASPLPGGGQAHGIFITAQKPGEWRGVKLVGLSIFGSDRRELGTVDDILVDDSGTITAVILGVGGFLGVGEKRVAVPFSSINWRVRATSGPGGTPPPATRDDPGGHGTDRASADDFLTTGGIPNSPVLNVTKADLENAPSFAYAGRSLTPSETQSTNAPNTSSNRLLPPTQTPPPPGR